MLVFSMLAALTWSPPASPAIVGAPKSPRTTVPVCADVYGRCLSGPHSPRFFRQPEPDELGSRPRHATGGGGSVDALQMSAGVALKEATKRLSAHDKASLTKPNAAEAVEEAAEAIEEYYAEYVDALRDAVRVLSAHSSSIMLGIMGDDAAGAVRALRSWQGELGLSQPLLRVLEPSGEALSAPMPDTIALGDGRATHGPSYLKFNSNTDSNMLKPHEGPFRGVIITASLKEGSVRQFGGLPLALFDDLLGTGDADSASGADDSASPSTWSFLRRLSTHAQEPLILHQTF